jgi:BlaI family penicillinase repressor
MVDRKKSKKDGAKEAFAEMAEAEWAIMKVVWEKQPCSAGAVQEVLAQSRNWAYSTVKTTMDRMVKKGFLEITRIRNLQLFSAKISKVQATREEFQKMLARAFDGALTPLMQYVIEHEDLSAGEIKELREMVAKARMKKKAKEIRQKG